MISLIIVFILLVLVFFIALFNIIYEEIFRVQYEVNVNKGDSVLQFNDFKFNVDLILYYFKGTKGIDKITDLKETIKCDLISDYDNCKNDDKRSICGLYKQFITNCNQNKTTLYNDLSCALNYHSDIDLSKWEKLDLNLKIVIIFIVVLIPTLIFIIALSQFYDTIVYLKDKKNSGKLTILRAKLKELALV